MFFKKSVAHLAILFLTFKNNSRILKFLATKLKSRRFKQPEWICSHHHQKFEKSKSPAPATAASHDPPPPAPPPLTRPAARAAHTVGTLDAYSASGMLPLSISSAALLRELGLDGGQRGCVLHA